MVTKRRRRSQLARAGAQRQQVRRAERETRGRRRRAVLSVLLVLVAVAALVTWILLHTGDGGSNRAGVDYIGGASSAAGRATTHEGVR